jgi:hypothetical protein
MKKLCVLLLILVLLFSCKEEKPEEVESHIAMIMTDVPRTIDQNTISRILHDDWGIDEVIREFQFENGIYTFNIGVYRVGMGLMQTAIPQQKLEYPLATAWYWENARQEISAHQSHCVVFVSSKTASSLDVLKFLTKLVFSLSRILDTVAIYWEQSSQVFQPSFYYANCDSFLEDDANYPLPIWVKITGMENKDDSFYLYSKGLSAFDQRELEIVTYRESFLDGYFFLLDLAHYLLINGPVIKDGDTVGGSENEKIKVLFKKSELFPEQDVLSLQF